MIKKISDFLQELGLTEIEARVYQGLIETGPTTVKNLSDHIGIKRITTHFNVESLITKGLITQTVHGSRRQIIAEPPERLKYLVERKLDAAKSLQTKFPDFLDTIEATHPTQKKDTEVEIKYYEGKRSVLSVYTESLQFDELYSFADLDRYYEIFPDTNTMWNKAYIDNPRHEVWDIVIDSSLARKIVKNTSKRYHMKFIQRSKFLRNFTFSDYLVFGNKLAIIQLDLDNIAATVIDSKNVAETFRAIHHSMWELLPK